MQQEMSMSIDNIHDINTNQAFCIDDIVIDNAVYNHMLSGFSIDDIFVPDILVSDTVNHNEIVNNEIVNNEIVDNEIEFETETEIEIETKTEISSEINKDDEMMIDVDTAIDELTQYMNMNKLRRNYAYLINEIPEMFDEELMGQIWDSWLSSAPVIPDTPNHMDALNNIKNFIMSVDTPTLVINNCPPKIRYIYHHISNLLGLYHKTVSKTLVISKPVNWSWEYSV